jgi:hypothetical protein
MMDSTEEIGSLQELVMLGAGHDLSCFFRGTKDSARARDSVTAGPQGFIEHSAYAHV